MPGNTVTGVFPCYENQFKIGASGSSTPATAIANCEQFSVTFNNGIQEWTAFENEGWLSREHTTQNIVIDVQAKRTIGDIGNDMVAACAYASRSGRKKNVLWTLPSGTTVLFTDAIINVSVDSSSGNAGDLGQLNFQIMSNGKPTVTPAA